jgi:hypothetical protein
LKSGNLRLGHFEIQKEESKMKGNNKSDSAFRSDPEIVNRLDKIITRLDTIITLLFDLSPDERLKKPVSMTD